MKKDDAQRLRQYHAAHARVAAGWAARGYMHPPPVFPVMPEDLARMTCGAKTRAGTPCKSGAIYDSGRCKLHGGLSTGPRSEAGKRQAAENGKHGGRPKTRNQSP
jgi:hypothetical protein